MSNKTKGNKGDEVQWSSQPATIIYTNKAWAKTRILLDHFQKEVAWHGVTERLEDGTYRISDILVYPQEVTGASVEMDTGEYAKWIGENWEDERFDHLKMQAHSHVNMSVTPSSTDIQHQKEILSQLGPEDFYIFIIFNKSLFFEAWIFDKKSNSCYETKLISMMVEDGFNVEEFLEEVDGLVKEAVVLPRNRTLGRQPPAKKRRVASEAIKEVIAAFGDL